MDKLVSKIVGDLGTKHGSGGGGGKEGQEDTAPPPPRICCTKLVAYGLPYEPTCIAYDPIQKLLAIGTKSGRVRLLGAPGVDFCLQPESPSLSVSQILFLVNEGALITIMSDDSICLWNYRQDFPRICSRTEFKREALSWCFIALSSKWLMCGTQHGNIYTLNTDTFQPCGYVIYWNKCVGGASHPGKVVHISESPADSSKILIGFHSGCVTLWDLPSKERCFLFDPKMEKAQLRDVSWHCEGKQFMSAYSTGNLIIWDANTGALVKNQRPHSKNNEDCRSIDLLAWRSINAGKESVVIFTNGQKISASDSNDTCLNIMQGPKMTSLRLQGGLRDLVVLCDSPYLLEQVDPYAAVVLLDNDLYVFDLLKSEKADDEYKLIDVPYSFDLHDPTITHIAYCIDSDDDLIPSLFQIGQRQKTKEACFSTAQWPVSGGRAGDSYTSYLELVITGHSNGDVRFWDATGITMQYLYLLKTSRHQQSACLDILSIRVYDGGEKILVCCESLFKTEKMRIY